MNRHAFIVAVAASLAVPALAREPVPARIDLKQLEDKLRHSGLSRERVEKILAEERARQGRGGGAAGAEASAKAAGKATIDAPSPPARIDLGQLEEKLRASGLPKARIEKLLAEERARQGGDAPAPTVPARIDLGQLEEKLRHTGLPKERIEKILAEERARQGGAGAGAKAEPGAKAEAGASPTVPPRIDLDLLAQKLRASGLSAGEIEKAVARMRAEQERHAGQQAKAGASGAVAPRLSLALRLPRAAQRLRAAGLSAEQVRTVLRSARERGLSPADLVLALEAAAEAVAAKARAEAVHAALLAGIEKSERGVALAAAVRGAATAKAEAGAPGKETSGKEED